jgi:cobalt-precorrin-7 (C5)-methyltransferase
MAIDMLPIMIVGCGPGSLQYLTPAGRVAIEEAEVLVGAPRLLETFASVDSLRISVGSDIAKVLAAMEPYAGHKKITVLVTGDPGLHSLAKPVIRRFGRDACRVIPGVSSIQTAFARLGLDWEDARILSLHGRSLAIEPDSLRLDKKIALLTGGEQTRSWLGALSTVLGTSHAVFVCSNLTLEDESVQSVEPCALAAFPLPSKAIVLFIDKECLL